MRFVFFALLVGACASSSATTPAANTAPIGASWRVTDMDGRDHDLAATLNSGRSVALVFWQSW